MRAFTRLGIVGIVARSVIARHTKDDEIFVAGYGKRAIAVGHWQIEFFDGFVPNVNFHRLEVFLEYSEFRIRYFQATIYNAIARIVRLNHILPRFANPFYGCLRQVEQVVGVPLIASFADTQETFLIGNVEVVARTVKVDVAPLVHKGIGVTEQSDNTCATVLNDFGLFRFKVNNSHLCTRPRYGGVGRIELVDGYIYLSVSNDIATGVGIIVLNSIRLEINFILFLQRSGID